MEIEKQHFKKFGGARKKHMTYLFDPSTTTMQ